jgi:hypothetical protein
MDSWSHPRARRYRCGLQAGAWFRAGILRLFGAVSIGDETMIWGSDYQHTDGIWAKSSKYIEEQFAGL